MASISIHMDWCGGKAVNIDCQYCTTKGKCTKIPKLFGLFLRDCVYLNDVGFKCHLQQEKTKKV